MARGVEGRMVTPDTAPTAMAVHLQTGQTAASVHRRRTYSLCVLAKPLTVIAAYRIHDTRVGGGNIAGNAEQLVIKSITRRSGFGDVGLLKAHFSQPAFDRRSTQRRAVEEDPLCKMVGEVGHPNDQLRQTFVARIYDKGVTSVVAQLTGG